MSRLIDADAIKIKPEYMHDICGVVMIRVEDIARILNDMPTIKPELQWIEVWEDDPSSFPSVNEDGYSEYVFLSLVNYGLICIGQYRIDEDGGAFYEGDNDRPLSEYGMMVNAWMPMIKPYKPKEE